MRRLADRLEHRAREEQRHVERALRRQSAAERLGRRELARYWDLAAAFRMGRRRAFETAARSARRASR